MSKHSSPFTEVCTIIRTFIPHHRPDEAMDVLKALNKTPLGDSAGFQQHVQTVVEQKQNLVKP